jgi:hypothetical protein
MRTALRADDDVDVGHAEAVGGEDLDLPRPWRERVAEHRDRWRHRLIEPGDHRPELLGLADRRERDLLAARRHREALPPRQELAGRVPGDREELPAFDGNAGRGDRLGAGLGVADAIDLGRRGPGNPRYGY